MKLQLVTLTGIEVDRDVYEVQLPTQAGPIGVFPDHEPLVSIAVPGAVTVRYDKNDSDEKLDLFAIGGGVIDISDNVVKVLVDEADRDEDIVESEVKAALERAKEMQKNATNLVELEKANAMMDKHQVRLNVANLRRRKRR